MREICQGVRAVRVVSRVWVMPGLGCFKESDGDTFMLDKMITDV